MSTIVEHLGTTPGLAEEPAAQRCGDNCGHLFKYLGLLCLAHEMKLQRDDDHNALRCRSCITDKTKEKEQEK